MHSHRHRALSNLQRHEMNYHTPYVKNLTVAGRRVNYYIVCFVEGFSDGSQQVTQGCFCLN
jgi:hypothetical protein